MQLRQRIERFLRSELGAVTVDWVVLTAAVVILVYLANESIYETSAKLMSDVGADLSTFMSDYK